MKRANRRAEKPMSCSAPMTRMANPQASTMGTRGRRVEHQTVSQPCRRDGEQLPLVGEVGGEEDAEDDLADLDRLELERANLDPQAGTLDVAPEPGHEGQEQQHDTTGQQQVAVAVEVPGPADHGQGDDVERHPPGRHAAWRGA